MATISPLFDGYFQQDNTPSHKARIISNWFLEHASSLSDKEASTVHSISL